MTANDRQTDIAIRFIRQWEALADTWDVSGPSDSDRIWVLACSDERDVPFMQKLFDARDYIKSTLIDSHK